MVFDKGQERGLHLGLLITAHGMSRGRTSQQLIKPRLRTLPCAAPVRLVDIECSSVAGCNEGSISI